MACFSMKLLHQNLLGTCKTADPWASLSVYSIRGIGLVKEEEFSSTPQGPSS